LEKTKCIFKTKAINKTFEENSLQEPATGKVTDMDTKERIEKLFKLSSHQTELERPTELGRKDRLSLY